MGKNEMNQEMSSMTMTGNQSAIYLVESFMEENFLFRRNRLSGKTEFLRTTENAAAESDEEANGGKEEKTDWQVLTDEAFNSIVRQAKKTGIGDNKSPRQDIDEYIKSDAVPLFDPIREYLEHLPQWDGKNHVAALFGRIPGLTSEQLGWLATWLRSAVAHWLQMDMLHGNEAVPVLIGNQGCGKSTFAVRLLPGELRPYFLDHINFGNKFDSEMALTKSQDDRPRYASFLATTNDAHPLCDPTGSRRYICVQVPDGEYIDNGSPIDYGQLYAQLIYELRKEEIPYWFTNDEVARIQERNHPYFKTDDLDVMLKNCFRMPADDKEGKWMISSEVFDTLHTQYPMLVGSMSMKVKIGQALKFMGCKSKHGQAYLLIANAA